MESFLMNYNKCEENISVHVFKKIAIHLFT